MYDMPFISIIYHQILVIYSILTCTYYTFTYEQYRRDDKLENTRENVLHTTERERTLTAPANHALQIVLASLTLRINATRIHVRNDDDVAAAAIA